MRPEHIETVGVHVITQLAGAATWPHIEPKLGEDIERQQRVQLFRIKELMQGCIYHDQYYSPTLRTFTDHGQEFQTLPNAKIYPILSEILSVQVGTVIMLLSVSYLWLTPFYSKISVALYTSQQLSYSK